MRAQEWFQRAKPFLGVVFLQLGLAGLDILTKAALNRGMSNYVLTVYRNAVAIVVIGSFAIFLDKQVRPKMTLQIFMKIIALSFIDPVMGQNMYFLGMKYTTATFAAAMLNMLPAITFVMACVLRLEKVRMKSMRSQAKVVGTVGPVAGAMIMTLVKGPQMWGHGSQVKHGVSMTHTVKGSLMLTACCFGWACFMVLQSVTLETYPAELSLTAWICLLGTLEATVVALIFERGFWTLTWDPKLLVWTLYSGIIGSDLAYYVQGLVMKDRGPVFVTAFSPLCMVIVAVMGSLFLKESVFLGGVIGAAIIMAGLYLVVWGKSKDHKSANQASGDVENINTGHE